MMFIAAAVAFFIFGLIYYHFSSEKNKNTLGLNIEAEAALAGDIRTDVPSYNLDIYPQKIFTKRNIVFRTPQKDYLLDENLSLVIAEGDSMEFYGIQPGDMILLENHPKKIEENDVITIRLPNDHPKYPNLLKLRSFVRYEKGEDGLLYAIVKKYDKVQQKEVLSEDKHPVVNITGKMIAAFDGNIIGGIISKEPTCIH